MFRWIIKFSIIFLFFTSTAQPNIAHCQDSTVRIKAKGRSYIGKELVYTGKEMALMRRDGRISILPVNSRREVKTISRSFKPYRADIIRDQLQKEFGNDYHVSTTSNFVVVHPPGEYQKWATPFEVLYQRFRNYFSSRGFNVDKPEFPLIVVVLNRRSEFDKFLKTYHSPGANILGYYSQKSNRIITYDPTGGRSTGSDWAYNDTLIHEAVHQTAYNTGIHRRYGYSPTWIVEGLACMFEAEGVYDIVNHPGIKERINQDRLAALKYYYKKGRVKGKLLQFVASDDLFQADAGLSYAYAWGLTFFLAEKYPAKYFRYLQADGKRSEFQDYTAKERTKAFTDAFGVNTDDLEVRMENFIKTLKMKR